MFDFYDVNRRVSYLYSLLQDDLSRDVFMARLQFDTCPSIDGWLRLIQLCGLLPSDVFAVQMECKTAIETLMDQGKQIMLYGSGIRGEMLGRCLLNDGLDIAGFCDQRFREFPEGLLGKTVYSPSFLLEHYETHYVIITSVAFRNEIVQFLKKNNFPENHILPYFSDFSIEQGKSCPKQYFEFPQLFQKGTAFVDAGCFDGQDSIYFAEWCNHEYTKIFAFEPDTVNYKRCVDRLTDIACAEAIHAGLGDCVAELTFLPFGNTNSRFAEIERNHHVSTEVIPETTAEMVQVTTLDNLTRDQKIGFIKMDIEGAEWQALHGAEQTILMDKPLLAICVYHIPGDMLAIMDYLAELVPEYRFWLRHYELCASEAVLYAAVNTK